MAAHSMKALNDTELPTTSVNLTSCKFYLRNTYEDKSPFNAWWTQAASVVVLDTLG